MNKWLKILLGLLAGLLLALVLAALLLPRLVDSDAIKQRLAAEASAAAGRPVSIAGDLDISLFPRLSVEAGGLSFGNPAGTAEPAGSVGQTRVHVALMPLLKGQMLVKGLQLEGVEVFFRDAQAGLDLHLSEASVSTGAVDLQQLAGASIPLKISGLLEETGSDLSLRFELAADAQLDPAAQLYLFDELTLRLQNPDQTGPPLRLSAGQVSLDLAAQSLALDDLQLQLAGLEIEGQLRFKDLLTRPGFSGRLTSKPFSPRALLDALGRQAPAMADSTALGSAQLHVQLEGTQTRLALKQLDLQLDDSRLSGELTARNPDQPVVKFDLDIDAIDLDRYLPPPGDEPAGAPNQPPGIALPVGGLTRLQSNGALRIGELKMLGVSVTRAEVQVSSAEGVARLHPISAELFGGRYSGDISIENGGTAPIISFDEHLRAVDLGALARQLAGIENISGTATARIQGVGAGQTVEDLIASLGGAVSVDITDGALQGIDVWHQVRAALALLRGTVSDSTDSGRTEFSRMQLEADIDAGLLTTNTLNAQLPFLNLAGGGQLDLGALDMDLGLVATLRELPELRDDPLTSGLVGRSLPLRISGPLSAPSVKVDTAELLRGELGNRLLERLGRDERDDGQAPDDSDPLEDQARNLLRELLGGSKPAAEEKPEDP